MLTVRRAIALILDLCLVGATALLLAFAVLAGVVSWSEAADQRSILMLILISALFDSSWRGQTPGKRALRIRVCSDGRPGRPITLLQALLRNFTLFLAPGLVLLAADLALLLHSNPSRPLAQNLSAVGFIGGLAIPISVVVMRGRYGLHDLVARTQVVDTKHGAQSASRFTGGFRTLRLFVAALLLGGAAVAWVGQALWMYLVEPFSVAESERWSRGDNGCREWLQRLPLLFEGGPTFIAGEIRCRLFETPGILAERTNLRETVVPVPDEVRYGSRQMNELFLVMVPVYQRAINSGTFQQQFVGVVAPRLAAKDRLVEVRFQRHESVLFMHLILEKTWHLLPIEQDGTLMIIALEEDREIRLRFEAVLRLRPEREEYESFIGGLP